MHLSLQLADMQLAIAIVEKRQTGVKYSLQGSRIVNLVSIRSAGEGS